MKRIWMDSNGNSNSSRLVLSSGPRQECRCAIQQLGVSHLISKRRESHCRGKRAASRHHGSAAAVHQRRRFGFCSLQIPLHFKNTVQPVCCAADPMALSASALEQHCVRLAELTSAATLNAADAEYLSRELPSTSGRGRTLLLR